MKMSKHPKGDYVNGDEVRSVIPLTFRLELVDEGPIPVGAYGKIENHDPSDNTWLVTWDLNGQPINLWVDPECFGYDKVTDEEMTEVFRLLGVDP